MCVRGFTYIELVSNISTNYDRRRGTQTNMHTTQYLNTCSTHNHIRPRSLLHYVHSTDMSILLCNKIVIILVIKYHKHNIYVFNIYVALHIVYTVCVYVHIYLCTCTNFRKQAHFTNSRHIFKQIWKLLVLFQTI